MRTFVQSGDIISEPATTNLKFNEGKSTKTVFGGIVSLLMIILLCYLTLSKGNDIIQKNKYFSKTVTIKNTES